MKKIYSVFMIAAALTMLWGCSSSDDDDVNNNNQKDEIHGTKVAEAPVWQVDMSTPPGDIDGMPNWEEVDFFAFEKDMTTIVYVSPIFGTEISADDRIAALVDGEVREVREPVPYHGFMGIDEITIDCFMLYIPYEAGEDQVELQYYCAQTNKTYIIKNAFSVNDDAEGEETSYFLFLRPLQVHYFYLPNKLPFTPSPDDKIGVFIGDECMGTSDIDDNMDSGWVVNVFNLHRSNEKAYVRYYSAATQTIYETEPYFTLGDRLNAYEADTLKFK